MNRISRTLAGLIAGCAVLGPCWAAAVAPAGSASSAVYAVVDGTTVSTREFEGALAAAARQKFYHRQPREEQLDALRREVTDRLVNRILLLKEAQRRGIDADEEKVRAEIEAYERRNRHQTQWQESRAHMLPVLTQALREQSLIAQLEAVTRAAPAPSATHLRDYYDSHPEQFTEPERVRLSMILLKIDPSAPAVAWEQALALAQDILKQAKSGADFAELARRHSDHESARDGGDMGYRHRGMLPPGVEKQLDQLAPGATSEPFRLLEGMAVFRLVERRPARLRKLEEVRSGVAELWAREQGETQWRELLARLRAAAEIRFSGGRQPGVVAGSPAGGQAAR